MSRECRHTTFSRHSRDILATLNTTRDKSREKKEKSNPKVEEKTESIDFAMNQVNSKVSVLEKQRNNLQDEITAIIAKNEETRRLGKRAYLAYDTLYIDGTPVRA
ncbi:hypothetical protein DPMN_046313 [Dreissena polymorpha]|uniref:Uncharacterized protein n=1 Tax=Dreissena polymorpha TaxID=45954 RepID=A0A9D4I0F8_DREPO|nr:hypothetical protein DPMN_046313 [Dreissena polymorpha]